MHLAVPGPDIYAEHAEDDLYTAIDKVTGKLSQQLKAQNPDCRPQETSLSFGERREEERIQASVTPKPLVEYKVKLEVFEGPLDLLLYLIKRDEVDVYDISIERIAKQYWNTSTPSNP